MSLSKQEYYRNAENLVQGTGSVLQSLFRSRWKQITGLEWSADHAYRYIPKIGKDIYNNASTQQKLLIQDGKVELWDVPLLIKILFSLSLPQGSGAASGNQQQRDKFNQEDAAIRTLKKLWYAVRNNKAKKLSRTEYEEIETTIKSCTIIFGEPTTFASRSQSAAGKTSETPQPSEPQKKVQNVTSGVAIATSSSSTGEAKAKEENKNKKSVAPFKIPKNLLSPERVVIVKRHRQCSGLMNLTEGMSHTIGIGTGNSEEYKLTINPRDENRLPSRCAGMEPIKIKEMELISPLDMEETYLNHIVHLTLIEDPVFMAGIHQVGQDKDGNVTRISFYEVKHDEEARKAMQFGRKVAVIHPWMKWNFDGGSGIRVEGTYSLVVRGLVKDMCRYCGKENAPSWCSKCKKARYCNRECQVADWKEFDHKLICAKKK